jgi:DNA polymerase-3 subunit delta'
MTPIVHFGGFAKKCYNLGIMWETFGHDRLKNILEKQLGSGKLPHAYLFSGPEGIGKKTLALEFAKKVLGAQKLESHPDFHILDSEGEIIVEQVLGFISKISYKPFLGAKKIAVINNAENLNIQSGNALLKTLEEPSESSIIILIAGPGKVLPTIVSRCQVLQFSSFSREDLTQFARAGKLELSEDLLALSFGRTGRLKKLSENKVLFLKEKEIIEEFKKLKKQPLGEKFSGISALAEMESMDLEKNLLSWFLFQTQALKSEPKEAAKVHALAEAIFALRKNMNKKLVLQSLFVKI